MTENTEYRTVTIPGAEEHQGFYRITATLPWRCIVCGEPRGDTYQGFSFDGSRRLTVDCWNNPCGHVEKYSMVRTWLKQQEEKKTRESAQAVPASDANGGQQQ